MILAWFERWLRDFRFGLRSLAGNPGFTAIAIGSLALGIGGSTAMYSVIYAVIIDPFPYKDVDRLMSVQVQDQGGRGSNGSYYSIDDFLEIAEHSPVFTGVVASTWSDVTWTGSGDPQRLRGNHGTMNTFEVMGVPPLIGRTPASDDARAGAEPVVVLGYKFWQRAFGGDPGVVGRKLRLNDKVRKVIGVMPQRFMWRGADVYLPEVFERGQEPEGVRMVHLIGRLKPGATRAQAAAEIQPIIENLARKNPNGYPRKWSVVLRSFEETFPSGIVEALWILFGAVGLLFLIACVNVSNLLLSRGSYRSREIAIRAALGAGRGRIVSQLLAESLLLGIAGGLTGVLLSAAGLRGIVSAVPPGTIPDEAKIALNAPVLAFTLAVSIGAALFFGLAPALQLSGRDLITPLKEAGRGVSSSAGQRALRAGLVVGEVALSLILLVGASLMLRSLLAMQNLEIGIHPERVLTMRIPFSERRYPDAARRVAFMRELARRIDEVPGVRGAAVTSSFHPVGGDTLPVEVAGNAEQDSRAVLAYATGAGYLAVMGIGLAEGRFFAESDVDARLHYAVVNQSFVRRYSPGRDAVGRSLRIPRLSGPPVNLADNGFQIIGVVKDTLNRLQTNEILPEVYLPYSLIGFAEEVVVAGNIRIEGLVKPVVAQVYAVDSEQPVMDVRTIERVLNDYVYAEPRFNLVLLGVFAALGVTLALFGVYGAVSNAVARRTREIGIRMALGAGFGEVMAMVLKMGSRLVGFGIAVGLLGSLASVRVLKGQVWQVSTFDPYSFAAVSILLFAAGLFAAFWPAMRAARVDPVTALRDE